MFRLLLILYITKSYARVNFFRNDFASITPKIAQIDNSHYVQDFISFNISNRLLSLCLKLQFIRQQKYLASISAKSVFLLSFEVSPLAKPKFIFTLDWCCFCHSQNWVSFYVRTGLFPLCPKLRFLCY